MVDKEMIGVCSTVHTEHTFSGQNVEFLSVKFSGT